jgi:hypothetical protein
MAEAAPPPQRRLSFYGRLSTARKREYDRSDAMRKIPIAAAPELGRAANAVVVALERGKPPAVTAASNALVALLCSALERVQRVRIAPPKVKVLRVRPRSAGGEFHGLYTRFEDGRSEIRVWMFTAREKRVVKPRTYLRTLLHEVVHHFDIAVFDLPSSLHTLGFHARESSLLYVLERSGATVPGGRRPRTPAAEPKVAPPRAPGAQLDLFGSKRATRSSPRSR